MTTFAPKRDIRRKERQLDERERQAWVAYSDSLRDLEGRDYEDAERESWERLQSELRELDEERAELLEAGPEGAERPAG